MVEFNKIVTWKTNFVKHIFYIFHLHVCWLGGQCGGNMFGGLRQTKTFPFTSFLFSLTHSLVRTNFPRAKQVLHLGSASLPTILILIVISTDWEIVFNIQRKAFWLKWFHRNFWAWYQFSLHEGAERFDQFSFIIWLLVGWNSTFCLGKASKKW